MLDEFMDEARQQAAQCWCDDATSDRVLDPALVEAVAVRIATWMDTAAQESRNTAFYRGLLDRCAKHLGPAAYTCDDGIVGDEPVRLNIPDLVKNLADKVASAEGAE